jgi:teichuronic acid biosynthesis glycosyltransferase TuaC
VKGLVTVEHHDPDADVLVVTNTWPHPGEWRYGIFAKRQVDSLIEAGLRCDVLFVRGFRSPLAYAVAAVRLLRLSLRRRYRLVHGHGGETLLPCLLFVGAPRVISFCGDDLLGTPGADGAVLRASRVKRLMLRELSRLTSATITKSREMQATLPGPVRARNTVLPNGVDRDLFCPIDRAAARRELGWPPDEHVALYAADPELPRKRYPLAVAACQRAAWAGVRVRLHVAHTTPPPLMPIIMNAADCLLSTSVSEGSSNVIKEAVTVGLPVIATPAGDVREILRDIHPSYICEPDPEALGGALVSCLRNGDRSNGRQRSEWLNQRHIAKQLLELYDRLS